MSKRIVDGFKTIEIDEHERHDFIVAGARESKFELTVKSAPVEEPANGIVRGDEFEIFCGTPLLARLPC